MFANREPNYLKTGKLMIDKMHIKNHTGCSRSFNSNLYPDLDTINTQRREQLNSELKKLNAMISYCKPKTAWQIITVYMCIKMFYEKKGH